MVQLRVGFMARIEPEYEVQGVAGQLYLVARSTGAGKKASNGFGEIA